jgi:hypothetical protein
MIEHAINPWPKNLAVIIVYDIVIATELRADVIDFDRFLDCNGYISIPAMDQSQKESCTIKYDLKVTDYIFQNNSIMIIKQVFSWP